MALLSSSTTKLATSGLSSKLAAPIRPSGPARAVRVPRATQEASSVTGLVFDPANAVKIELTTVDKTPPSESLGRVAFDPECEAAINEQINVEYNVSYVYHALHCFFDRDNVGLPGFAKFFKAASDEERDHAHLLMSYQNKRGGRVQLKSIVMPEMEFNHPEKGEALFAMELALSLEKLNFQKLRELHEVADKCGDAPMADFVEGDLLADKCGDAPMADFVGDLLADQVNSVKSSAELVSQLRRVGKGLGVYHIDKQLQ